MASAKGIRAGRAFVELFADDSKLVRGLKAAQARLKAFGAAVRAMGTRMLATGAAIVAPMIGAVKHFAAAGDQLNKMAIRTGTSAEALSELGFAAEQTGADLTSLGNALFRMRRRIANAATGTGPAVRALEALGLTAQQLTQLTPDEQLKVVADALGRVSNQSLAAQYAFEIFGDGAKKLLPLLAEGADGIEALQEEARRLGLTVSTADAQAAADYADAWNRVTRAIKAAVFAVGSALAPMLTDMLGRVLQFVVAAIHWIKANKTLIATLFKLGAAVMGAGLAVVLLGTLISGVGAILGVFVGLITGVGTALAVLAKMIMLLLSPITLVIAAIGAFAAYLVYATGAGGKALKWLGDRFAGLAGRATKAFQGIGDALAAGDIGLAAKILWLTLKMEWQRGVAALNEVWASVKNFFLAVWTEAVYGAAALATNAWAGMQTAWVHTVDFLKDAWSIFTTWVVKSWHTASGFVQKAWVKLKSLFDDELDAEAEITRINEEVAAKNQAADEQRDRIIVEREQARRQRLGQIEQERTGALDQLDQMREEEHAARQRQTEKDLGASEQALDKARQEWQAAIAEAARKRKETEDAGEPDRLKEFRMNLDSMSNMLGDISHAQVNVRGTFSAFGVRGLGAKGPAERTADATEQIARHTKDLARRAQQGGVVFE